MEGAFQGTRSGDKRVEDWMEEEPPDRTPKTGKPMSYREAVKKKASDDHSHYLDAVKEADWDGFLFHSSVREMTDGITITDSSTGPIFEFSEAEKERLERKWDRSLIIKLLGGTLGFMVMRRRVQAMWGKEGRVDLNDIGNGYFVASFQSLDDYFFALEEGPWMIANHYLTVQTWK